MKIETKSNPKCNPSV